MIKIKTIIESISIKQPLIVVDIQPSSDQYMRFDNEEFVKFLNLHEGEINYFFNGPELGYEDESAVIDWLNYNGLTNESINFIEKDFGWIRDPMDQQYNENSIIKTLQYMIKKDYYDARDLSESELRKLNIDEDLLEDLLNENTYIGLPSVIEEMKDLPKSGMIVGGGENECLLEMEITLQALKKKYKRNNKFTY